MTVPFNALGRAAAQQREALLGATAAVIDSGWLVHGRQHRSFEAELAGFLQVAEVCGVGNGTDALEIGLRAVRRDRRQTVVTVANAGGYTTTAARAAGLRLRYCDVDPQTLLLDPARLGEAVDADTFAVVVTHLYGRAADVAAVRAVVPPGIAVIEDCAQSIGARTTAGMTGSLADLGTFSFYPTKNLGALGDGGAITTNDPELARRVRQLAQYGWVDKYTVGSPGGRNSRLDELQAAYLRLRLPLVEPANQRRREIIARYQAAAPASVRVLPEPDAGHAAHLAVVVTDDAARLAEHLASHDIQTAVHYPVPDHRQPAYHDPRVSLPVTESLVGRILSLPLFSELTEAEIEQVCDALAGA